MHRIECLGAVDDKVRENVERVLTHFFPEVTHLRVKQNPAHWQASTCYEPQNRAISIQPGDRDDVIAHEIIHYMQDKRNHADGWVVGQRPPHGEKSTDVYVCARHKELACIYSSYLDINYKGLKQTYSEHGARELLHEKAVEALMLRRQGLRRYIQHMEQAVNAEINKKLAHVADGCFEVIYSTFC